MMAKVSQYLILSYFIDSNEHEAPTIDTFYLETFTTVQGTKRFQFLQSI